MTVAAKVRFGDGKACRFAPTVLEDLGALVVYAGKAGRGYGDDLSLRQREIEADEKAASIRADMQRMLREAQAALLAGAQPSAWSTVRDHARKAGAELQTLVQRWQEQANQAAERTKRNLAQYQRDISSSMQADLFAYIRRCMLAAADSATLVRRLGPTHYADSLQFEAAAGLRAEVEVDELNCSLPQRLRAYLDRIVLEAGVRKALFGGEKPRALRLDSHFVVEAVLSPRAIDLRLAPRLKPTPDVVLLRLRPENGRIKGNVTLGNAQREEAVGDETLHQLWDALQNERLEAVARPSRVVRAELDGRDVAGSKDCFASAERLIDRWRPIVSDLARHTPGPDELCILVANDEGLDDELWVRTADLTQHLLTIPISIRSRLSPKELLGPAQVTRESDIINLGRVMEPDAGQDSDVIDLQYIPPESAGSDSVEAGAPSQVVELASADISVVELGRDPEETSGCYDLSKLGRTVQSG